MTLEASSHGLRVSNCQFAVWYPLFRSLTPKSKILACPEQFRQYLLADGIHLPGPVEHSGWSDGEDSDSENNQDCPTVPDDFDLKIADTIKELNGAVCPKLNWSSPKDAVWISPTNDMKCIMPNDIYLLLKSSDYCTFDLEKAHGDHGAKEVTLILREWFDILPSLEFRCFVREGELVGATQRDLNYYSFLHDNRARIEKLLESFIPKVSSFPDASVVVDVYIPKGMSKVWLIDFNPWLERTDTLLFSWYELNSHNHFELRLVNKDDQTREFGSKPHTVNHVPYDFIDMDGATAEELIREMKKHT